MSQLYHSIVYNNKDVRDICHYPKHKHLPFSNSLSKVAASFELLHFDIWGPISISYIHGHKYFLTIFDDHRRFLWIILLKTKDKVSTRVKNFIAMIKNQFNTTPKFVRTDNVPEFLLYDFYSSHDIVHQKSSVETCQQNGRVERKRQHILNVGKALLFQSKLPPSFWSYVILHVVFFINRSPHLFSIISLVIIFCFTRHHILTCLRCLVVCVMLPLYIHIDPNFNLEPRSLFS